MKKMTAFLSMLSMLVMIVFVVWQVFTRYLLRNPSAISEEIIGFSLIALSFLGGAYCFTIDEHIAISLVDSWTKRARTKHLLYSLRQIANLCFALLLLTGSLFLVWQQRSQLSTTLKVPMSFVYAIPGVAALFICLSSLYKLFTKKDFPLEGETLLEGE